MIVVYKEESNIVVYIEHEINKIDLDIIEPPLILPSTQEIDKAVVE